MISIFQLATVLQRASDRYDSKNGSIFVWTVCVSSVGPTFADENRSASKTARKNKKRSEKRLQAKVDLRKTHMAEAVKLKDPVEILRDKLQEAKDNKVRKYWAYNMGWLQRVFGGIQSAEYDETREILR